ncbi:MAG: hypothetical protein WBV94_15500 [Blastocatellia bacterium]
MNDNKGNDGIGPLILIGGAVYAIYRLVEAVVTVVTVFLMELATIALVGCGLFAAYWLYRYVTDKQYGETKNLQQIEKLERQRKLHTSRLPKHLKEQANEYYIEKQREFYDMKPHSRVDAMLDRTKQVFSTFRKREKWTPRFTSEEMLGTEEKYTLNLKT